MKVMHPGRATTALFADTVRTRVFFLFVSLLAIPCFAQERPAAKVSFNAGTIPATMPGQHKFIKDAHVKTAEGKAWDMSYLVHLPNDYAATKDKKPLFIYLCGNTHQGSDLTGMLNEGPAMYLNEVQKLREYFPFVGLFPQPPEGMRWDTPGMDDATVAIIEKIISVYRIDSDRVYITGSSMGGKGTWIVALKAPKMFAAISPMSSVAVEPNRAAKLLKHVPMWLVVGSDDGGYFDGTKEMYKAVHDGGGDAKLTVIPNGGHEACRLYYPEPKFYDWLLTHKRGELKDAGKKSPPP